LYQAAAARQLHANNEAEKEALRASLQTALLENDVLKQQVAERSKQTLNPKL
jgi:hypothetical protein